MRNKQIIGFFSLFSFIVLLSFVLTTCSNPAGGGLDKEEQIENTGIPGILTFKISSVNYGS